MYSSSLTSWSLGAWSWDFLVSLRTPYTAAICQKTASKRKEPYPAEVPTLIVEGSGGLDTGFQGRGVV